jgi:hypothetical protein
LIAEPPAERANFRKSKAAVVPSAGKHFEKSQNRFPGTFFV